MDRYSGKPFLRLIECYILSAIDQLTDQQRNTLHIMEPKLQMTYGMTGTWSEIVSKQMDFPESLPEKLREIWAAYLSKAKMRGESVDPDEFVILFVNENFPEAVQ